MSSHHQLNAIIVINRCNTTHILKMFVPQANSTYILNFGPPDSCMATGDLHPLQASVNTFINCCLLNCTDTDYWCCTFRSNTPRHTYKFPSNTHCVTGITIHSG